MKKRQIMELENLRARIPDEFVTTKYPVDLLLGFRKTIDYCPEGWRALPLDREQVKYDDMTRRAAVDVVFHHTMSGIMIVSPSLGSSFNWRVIYPGDGILCSPSVLAIRELVRIRYEITPPNVAWMKTIIEQENPWSGHPAAPGDEERDTTRNQEEDPPLDTEPDDERDMGCGSCDA